MNKEEFFAQLELPDVPELQKSDLDSLSSLIGSEYFGRILRNTFDNSPNYVARFRAIDLTKPEALAQVAVLQGEIRGVYSILERLYDLTTTARQENDDE